MGDYKSVIDFANWAKQTYPARHYMLIVWNHGAGWIKGPNGEVTKGISYDDETNHHITTPQMGAMLKGINGVDVYGSDACLMQMAEVDYEIKDYAKIIVGSEETEPGDGYTYNTFLGPLAARPAMTPAELARTAVDAYIDHYKQQRTGSTQSFVRAAALPGLMARVDAWTAAVMAAGLKAEVNAARGEAMSYAISENKDLYHFVGLVAAKTAVPAVKAASPDLQTYIARDLVLYNRFNDQPDNGGGDNSPDNWEKARWGGKDYSESHGIAVYLPGSELGDGYKELAWAAATKWTDFIAWYQAK
jgi:hypothetical protein